MLNGTEKQIAYANDLKEKFVNSLNEEVLIPFSGGLKVKKEEVVNEINSLDSAADVINTFKMNGLKIYRNIAKKHNIKGA